MGEHGRELYREFTGWASWVHLVTWGAIGASAWVSPWPWWAILLLFGGLLQIVLGGLLVTVHTRGVRVGLGRVRLIGTFIPFSDVVGIESVTYRPMREFGGWGYRGTREKRAWTARGDRAVVIRTVDDRRIYIGSDEPSSLEGRIRNALATGGPTSDRASEERTR